MRFGILGTADIARDSVVPGIRKSDHEAAAVASRDQERAERFAADCDVPEAYGSYEALFDADIDAVYNPLPNALHAEWTERAADAGLHVLCEKPLTTTADRAADLFDYCADAGVTLMEAFMYQFHPRTERAREVAAEELGDVRSVDATFKFRLPGPPDIRLDADLGGGALFDVGSYAVSAARGFLGEPDRAYARFSDTRDSDVDTDVAGLLEYDDGRTARVSAGFDTAHVQRYRVEAADGFLDARDCFAPGEREVTLRYGVDGRAVEETFDAVDQYEREVEGFAEAAASGSPPRVDRAETLGNARARRPPRERGRGSARRRGLIRAALVATRAPARPIAAADPTGTAEPLPFSKRTTNYTRTDTYSDRTNGKRCGAARRDARLGSRGRPRREAGVETRRAGEDGRTI